MNENQFVGVRPDERSNYTVRLRPFRLNKSVLPELRETLEIAARPPRIFAVNSHEQLQKLTAEYREYFRIGNLAVMYNDDDEDNQIFVWGKLDGVESWQLLAGGSGGGFYTNPNPSVIGVGGIPPGTTFDNVTLSGFINSMLYPELFGTLTNPSVNFTANAAGFREVGEQIPSLVFNTAFSRGSINPQYDSDEPFRSGLPSRFVYTGPGLVNKNQTTLTDTQTITNYTVTAGPQNWTCRVEYDEGVQPIGNKGSEFNAPLPAGQTPPVSQTITGVYPVFATAGAIASADKQTLMAHNSMLEVELAQETGGNKQMVEFPLDAWDPISQIQQWNELTLQWGTINIASFTVSIVQHVIQGVTVDYRRYTHTGPGIGRRNLRFIV